MMQRNLGARAHSTPATATAADGLPMVASKDLFRGTNTLRIAHAGHVYQLRITRENKLILTK